MKTKVLFQKNERGQSFLEFAISLIFLLTLLAAAADLGTALFTMIALRDVAQEASVYGAICPDRLDKVKERLVKSASAPIDINDIRTEDIVICVVNPSDPTNPDTCGAPIELGNSIKVSVTVQHKIVTPFVGSVIGQQEYPLTATVLNTIMRTACYE